MSAIEQYDRPLDALAHRLWTHWSQHIAEEEDISEERLQRWQDLWIPYGELSEDAKETDRRLVERFCEEEPDYNRSVDTATGQQEADDGN
ncbi:hypothetical protein [Haloarcula onubensis]|uniref:Uncharacterized protein n=1 Tax=Haloarcula onubensis TaxID=2950539 RepID=A0ABU2FWS4_9EURY|nr:hypothetical protein [Halomicroarcula sp. S3CR25-11]MDS0284696.1 hypothetical protein [Halomicroarcula sp. S3CR25-11]